MLVARDITFVIDKRLQQNTAMEILNPLRRAMGTSVAKPDVGGQKVLLVEQNRAIAQSMVKVIPEEVIEQLSLLGVMGEGKAGKVARDIVDELGGNVILRYGRFTSIRSSRLDNKQRGKEYTTKT
jgi:hypothetical protein